MASAPAVPPRAIARRIELIAIAGALVIGLAVSAAQAKTVRVFAIGNKLAVRSADTYGNFRDTMFALVDAQHPRRSELVQVDVDDVASHLRPADAQAPAAALVNFPEDVGLVAGLIGTRGVRARRATIANGGSVAAFGALIQEYDPQIQYYANRFPGLPTVRYLLLAETDTFYRAAYETFRDMARTYGVYLTATFNVAPARRLEMSDAPDLVTLLRDPDEAQTRSYAYIAVSSDVYNTTFVFDPDGNILIAAPGGQVLHSPSDTEGILRGSLNKAYLTQPEQDTLPLAFGRVKDLDVIDTPVGRIASVISKDAWMIDVNDRYDTKGAQLILQPEAFSEWAYVATPWQPDGYKSGGFAQIQRNPSYQYNVAPSMTGNLFDVTFDGQSSIVGKRYKTPAEPPSRFDAWIGQNPDSGFLAIAPWVLADPGIGDALLTLAQRRQLLADAGAHLLPGARPKCSSPQSYGPCENGYRESVIFADVVLPDNPNESGPPDPGPLVVTAYGVSARVDSGGMRVEHVHVAAHGGTVYAVWQDARAGYERIFLAVSHDRGAHFTEQRVSDNAAGAVVELRPALALTPNGIDLFVVWQEFCAGRDDDCGRIKLAHFDHDGRKIRADTRIDAGADTAGKWTPAVTVTGSGNPLVAWVDERDSGPGGLPLEHIYFVRGRRKGTTFGPNVRVDAGAPAQYAEALDNKWAPAVTVSGRRIYVAWTDFRNYNWDIFFSHSANGLSFAPNVRVDDFPDFERIHDHPAIAADNRGVVHAVWADRRATDADTNIYYARSTDGGRRFSANRRIDGSAEGFDPNRDPTSNQWHPELAVSGSDVVVVWQDNRLGNNDIFAVRSRDRGLSFEADVRVDDSGDGRSNQYRPAVCVDDADPMGRAAYVVWEDDRQGTSRAFIARRPLD